jgi:hypothetical protein
MAINGVIRRKGPSIVGSLEESHISLFASFIGCLNKKIHGFVYCMNE